MKVSKAGLQRGFKDVTVPGVSSFDGRATSNVETVSPQSYESLRTQQFLRHLATVMKNYLNEVRDRNVVEIQVAEINGRYIVACNRDENSLALFQELANSPDIKAKMMEMSSAVYAELRTSEAAAAEQSRRHAAKLYWSMEGSRDAYDASAWHAARDAVCTHLAFDGGSQSIEALFKFIDGPPGGPLVMILTMTDAKWAAFHAEQKILFAFCKSFTVGRNERIEIAGGFRACLGCLESLNVVREFLLPNLEYTKKGGRYWDTTSCGHKHVLGILVKKGFIDTEDAHEHFDRNGLMKSLVVQTHHSMLRQPGGKPLKEVKNVSTDSLSSTRLPTPWMLDVYGLVGGE